MNLKLPKFLRRSETRGYTDLFTSRLLSDATAGSTADASRSAALEIAAGLWSRSMSMAEVSGAGAFGDALTADVLAFIGRELCRCGEAVFVIETMPTARLIPAANWDVYGGADPASWMYRVNLDGPSRQVSRVIPADGLIHVRYAISAKRPHVGLSPLQVAADAGRLTGFTDRALGDEMSMPHGALAVMPDTAGNDDDEVDPLAAIRDDIGKLAGQIAFVETTAEGGGTGRSTSPQSDWMIRRVGADVPAAVGLLHSQAAMSALAACGVTGALAGIQTTDGASRREALRQFLRLTIAPIARLVAVELRRKLDVPELELDFNELYAADIRTQAQAFASLVAAGLEQSVAAKVAGVDDAV